MPSELVTSTVVSFIVPLVISLVHMAAKSLTEVSLMLASDLFDIFPILLVILLATAFAKGLTLGLIVIALFVPAAIIVLEDVWDEDAVLPPRSGLEQDLYVLFGVFDTLYASNTAQLARHLRSEAIAGLTDYVFGPETYEDIPPPPALIGPKVDQITEQLMMGIKANWERYLKDMLVPLKTRFHLLLIDSPHTPLGDPSLVRRPPLSMRATFPVEIISIFLISVNPTFDQFKRVLNLADKANTFHSLLDESHLVISTHKGFMVMGEQGFLTLHHNMLHGALEDNWDDSMQIPTIELLANVECKEVDDAVSQPIKEESEPNKSSRIFHSSMTQTMNISSASDSSSSASDTSNATLVDSPSGNQDAQLIECMFPAKDKCIASPANDSFTTQPAEVSWLGLDGDTSIEGERPVFILPEGHNSICLSRPESPGEKPPIGPSDSIGDSSVIPGSTSGHQLLDALPNADISVEFLQQGSVPSKHPVAVAIVSAPDSPTSIPDAEPLDGTQDSFVIPSSSDALLLDISLPSMDSSLELELHSAPIPSADIRLPDTDVILGMDSLLIPSTSGVQLLDMSLPAIDTSIQCLEQGSAHWNYSPISDSFPGLLPDTDALCYDLGQGMDAYAIPSISHILPLNTPLDVSIERGSVTLAIASISEPQPPDSSLPNPDSAQYTDQQMESLIIPSLSDIQLLDASLPPMDTSMSSAPFDTSSTSDSLVSMSPDCIQHANFLALPSTTGLDRIDAALSKIEACIAALKDPPAIVSTSLPNTDSVPQLDQESHYSFVVPSLSDFQLLDASLPGIDISLDHWECESISLTLSAAIQQSISLPNTGLTRFSDDSFVIPSMSGIQLISSASLPDMDTSMYYSESGSWDHLSFAIPSTSDLQLCDISLTGLNVSIAYYYSEVDSDPKLPPFVDDCMERGEWESHASQTFLVPSSSSGDIGELFLYGTDVGMPADYSVWEEEEEEEEEEPTFIALDDLGDPEDDWSIARVGETSYEEYEEEAVTLIFRLGSIRSPPV